MFFLGKGEDKTWITRGTRGSPTLTNMPSANWLKMNYRSLLNPGNIKDLEKPKKKTGEMICLRCHTMGYCFPDCKYVRGHGTLDNEEAQVLATFVGKARENKKAYLASRKMKSTNGEENKEEGK